MSPSRIQSLVLQSLLAVIFILGASACGRAPGSKVRCLLILHINLTAKVTSNSALDGSKLQMLVSYNGGDFEDESVGSAILDDDGSLNYGLSDRGPGTYQVKLVNKVDGSSQTQSVVLLRSQNLSACGPGVEPAQVNFTLQ